MTADDFDAAQLMAYWRTEAKEALQVADHLFEKADYSYALFFGHLAIEKVLKALYVARLQEHAPPIHNLLRLAAEIDDRIEPHPFTPDDFTSNHPLVSEIRRAGVRLV